MSVRDEIDSSAVANEHRGAAGFTLVEMVIALVIATLMSASIIRCVIVAKTLNHANEQRVIAFGLAKSKIEELQGKDYESVTNEAAEANLPFTHLGEKGHIPLFCDRQMEVLLKGNPERKELRSAVSWKYRGRQFAEQANTVIYPK